MARRALLDMEGNTGANTREKSCEKPPAGHRQGGGLDEETTNTRDGRCQHLHTAPLGEEVFRRKKQKTKQNKYNTQNINDDTQTRTLVAPRLWAEEGVGRAILKGPPVNKADLVSRHFRGGQSVLRLSLGKLLVNLLQVVKRTNTPLIP